MILHLVTILQVQKENLEKESKKKMKKYISIFCLFMTVNAFGQFAEEAASLVDNQYGFGAKSIGMGSAFTAVADNYSATYWNPAGLAQIKKMEVYAELSHLTYESNATYNGNLTNSSDSFTKLNSFGLVFPLPTYRGSLVFSLGYQKVKDFDNSLNFSGFSTESNDLFFSFEENGTINDYYFDKDVQREELIQQDGSLNNWSFAAAVDVSPNVSVGAALNLVTGSSSYLFDFYQEDINDVFPVISDVTRDYDFKSYALSQKILSDYSAFQVKVGALLRPTNSIKFGMNITLPSTINVVEKFNENDALVFDDDFVDALEGDPGEFEYDVSLPFQIGLGMAYSAFDFTAALDVELTDVSQIEFEAPGDVSLNSDYSALLDENKRIKDIYEQKFKIKAGIEYLWQEQSLAFRAGYMLDQSPLQNADSDFDKQFFSGGLGIIVDKQVVIDLAYLYGSWKQFSSDSFTPSGTDEDVTYQKIYLTTSFRF